MSELNFTIKIMLPDVIDAQAVETIGDSARRAIISLIRRKLTGATVGVADDAHVVIEADKSGRVEFADGPSSGWINQTFPLNRPTDRTS